MMTNIGALVASAWETVMLESPVSDTGLVHGLLSGRRYTYREVLDRPRWNVYGEAIPRIVLVRRNLARMKTPRLWPPQLPV